MAGLAKGAPTPENMLKMARVWWETQTRLWSGLAGSALLPASGDDVLPGLVRALAGMYDRDGGSGAADLTPPPHDGTPLGVAYLRYSCDSSNSRSLDAPLHGILVRAHQQGVFIPWGYVCADAAFTGTVARRPGYLRAKATVTQTTPGSPGTLYVDELSRASRDMIEMLTLGRQIDTAGKRIVGVSDGFDSALPQWKMQLSMAGIVSEAFIDQIKPRIRRGMRGAARRGTSTGRVAFGYKLEPVLDDRGQTLIRDNGKPLNRVVIDPDQAPMVVRVFEMFVHKGRSICWIGRYLDRIKAGGRKAWHAGSVRQLLRRETYAGVRVYGQHPQQRDPATGRCTRLTRAREDCEVVEVPELRIIDPALFEAAQRRLEEAKAARPQAQGSADARARLYPRHMLSGLLRCKKHGHRLTLMKTGANYQQWHCNTCSREKYHGVLRSKSSRMIDAALLGELTEVFRCPALVAEITRQANTLLAESGGGNDAECHDLAAALKKAQARAHRLRKLVCEYEGEHDMSGYLQEEADARQEAQTLGQRLAERSAAQPPEPVTTQQVAALLSDLPGLLRGDPSQANRLLRATTGVITVDAVKEPGQKFTTWVLEPEVDFLGTLKALALQRKCPTSYVWEYLNTRNWTIKKRLHIPVRRNPLYERHAQAVAAGHRTGKTCKQMARELGIAHRTACDALAFARSGTRSSARRYHTTRGKRWPRAATPLYQRVARESQRLRSTGLSQDRIARALDVSSTTVRAALNWTPQPDTSDGAGDN